MSAIDLVERRVALAINNARHDYVADADWLPTEEEVAEVRAAIEASGLADTIARLQAALDDLVASCTRTTPALHDDCGTRIVTAPTVDALKKARDALRSSVGGE